jgi:hypothetical protein
MCAEGMPAGYTFVPEPNAVASAVLSKSTWAVLALTCHIELFVLAHYRESIDKDSDLSPLFKDVLFFHAREEAQHAILDELEWRRANANVSAAERDAGVDDLVCGRRRPAAGAGPRRRRHFFKVCGRALRRTTRRTALDSLPPIAGSASSPVSGPGPGHPRQRSPRPGGASGMRSRRSCSAHSRATRTRSVLTSGIAVATVLAMSGMMAMNPIAA